jgi:hypothetical protein
MKPRMKCPSIEPTMCTSCQLTEQNLETCKFNTQEVVVQYHVKTNII